MGIASDEMEAPQGWVRKGLRIQGRVIGALMLRDLHTRYGRENIGYLWLILEPMFLAAAIGMIHSRGANHFGGDIKPVPAALIGYCNFMTFRTLIGRSEGALEANQSLFYHRTVTPFDVLFSRALLEQAGTFMAFCLLMGLAVATGIANPPARPLFYLFGVLAMLSFSFSLSMVVCGVTHERRSVGRLIHPLIYVMMPLSGAFFTMEALPKDIREILLVIPLAHINEILRYGWFKSASPAYFDVAYLLAWIMGTMLLGLLLLSSARKRIHMI